MRPEDLRAYADRDWARVDELKRSRWRQRRERLGPIANFSVGCEIYAHARRTQPDWPSCESRQQDLTDHLALSKKLRAVRRR